jgi:hypothetical protein
MLVLLKRTLPIAVAAALLAPAAASAASKPTVTTGGASNIAPTSVTLSGRVDPNNADTTYFFRLGTTKLYGIQTAVTSAGSGGSPVRVSATVTGLAPATRYHYRLYAVNEIGIGHGIDRTFKTKIQPLGVSLSATPNPIAPGAGSTLAGTLSGTNNAHRAVVLQANPFPYTQGFATVGNPQLTDASGNFSFSVLSVPVTTQYRVLMPSKPQVVSPIVVLGTALQVITHTKKVKRHRHSVGVRFRGTITPANDGGRVAIQKFRNGAWAEIAHTTAKDDGTSQSRFRKRVRLHRSGQYRVVAEAQGAYVSGAGRAITIKVRR